MISTSGGIYLPVGSRAAVLHSSADLLPHSEDIVGAAAAGDVRAGLTHSLPYTADSRQSVS